MNKSVVITGGTRGIGKALAIKFKTEGYNVLISYLHSESAAVELREKYGVLAVKLDSKVEEDVKKLFDISIREFGCLSGVICNAGIAIKQKPIFDVEEKEVDELIAANLKGAFFTVKHAAAKLWQTGGKIITVSSVWGINPAPCEAAYAMTKAGIIALTKSVSEELSDSKVILCSIAPGLIDTDMNDRLSESEKLEFVRRYGLEKVPTPSEAAEEIYKKFVTLKKGDGGKVFKIFC